MESMTTHPHSMLTVQVVKKWRVRKMLMMQLRTLSR